MILKKVPYQSHDPFPANLRVSLSKEHVTIRPTIARPGVYVSFGQFGNATERKNDTVLELSSDDVFECLDALAKSGDPRAKQVQSALQLERYVLRYAKRHAATE